MSELELTRTRTRTRTRTLTLTLALTLSLAPNPRPSPSPSPWSGAHARPWDAPALEPLEPLGLHRAQLHRARRLVWLGWHPAHARRLRARTHPRAGPGHQPYPYPYPYPSPYPYPYPLPLPLPLTPNQGDDAKMLSTLTNPRVVDSDALPTG